MQNVVVDKPYRFIPPHHGDWVPWWIQRLRIVDWYLKKFEGIESHEVRGVEQLQASLQQGHGVILAPNHCRYADPITMGWIARQVDVYLYAMASWHLFHQSRLQALAMRLCGGFSVYREGVDRQSLNTAIEILVQAKRPLIVFPEGTVFRSNDQLQPLLDGVGFLARAAAKRRSKHNGGQVVIHPVAIKYLFRGQIATAIEPTVNEIEQRLTLHWTGPQPPLLQRIERIEQALLSLQEIKYLGGAQSGTMADRQRTLIEHLLRPLELDWLGRWSDDSIMPRVKQLRTVIVPKLIDPQTQEHKKQELWGQLADIYMAQQIASHPPGYLQQPTDMRVLETVERMEEDLTDRARIHRPLHAILQIGAAIEVDGNRPGRDGDDPLMRSLAISLQSMLDSLASEARPWEETD